MEGGCGENEGWRGLAMNTPASVFSLLKIIQLKNIYNNNNNNKVMFWISITVNLQQQSPGEFCNVFTTTNQNYVTFYCV